MVTVPRQLGEKRGRLRRDRPSLQRTWRRRWRMAPAISTGACRHCQWTSWSAIGGCWRCVDAWWTSTMSGRRRQEQAKRVQRTNLATRSVRPSARHDLLLVGLQAIGRIGVDTVRPVAIEKRLLLGVVQPKPVGRISARPCRRPAAVECPHWVELSRRMSGLRMVADRAEPPRRHPQLDTD